jgi:MFS family permease
MLKAGTSPGRDVSREKRPLSGFVALVLGGGLYQAATSTISTMIAPLLNSRGISAEQIGLLNSANWAVVTVASIPAGRLSDKVGRLLPFLISALSAAVAWGALYFRTDLSVSFLAFAMVGLSLALFTPNSTAVISERFNSRVAPILFAVFYLSTWGGAAIASVLAGWASEKVSPSSPLLMASFLYALSGVALVASVLTVTRTPGGNAGTGGTSGILDVRSMIDNVGSNPLLASYGFALFFHALGYSMITPYFSLYADMAVGLDMTDVGLVMAAWNVGMMAGIIPWGWVSARSGSEVTLVGHFLFSAVSWPAITLSRDLSSAIALAFLFGLVGSMDMPARRSLTAELSPKERLAEATGFIELVNGTGGLVGSLLGGLAWERLGPAFPFYIAPLMTLVSVPPMLKLASRLRNITDRRSQGTPTFPSSRAVDQP